MCLTVILFLFHFIYEHLTSQVEILLFNKIIINVHVNIFVSFILLSLLELHCFWEERRPGQI